ncbi:MAG TPA: dihydrodipicolinate synthase family protein [Gemmatimonadaceae bacterium]|nr:dihydrodipicolinate synthase family protein [Gemmatimonadaceae bacterium]
MTRRLSGVLGPVVTPFDAAGEVDASAFRANVRAHLAQGLSGIVVAGSTGEAPLLDEDERRALVACAREETADDRWVVVGIGGESTRITIRRASDAAERGADAVLVVSPHYYGSAMTTAALRAHFLAVADASPIPVVLYNIPKYTHAAIDPVLVGELATHQNVIGIKDSSGDLEMLRGYLRSSAPDFAVLTGHAGTYGDARALGAAGGILAIALFAAHLVHDLDRAVEEGDAARRAPLQEHARTLGREIVAQRGVAGVKAALDQVGMTGGAVRPPLMDLDDAGREQVRAALAAAGQASVA